MIRFPKRPFWKNVRASTTAVTTRQVTKIHDLLLAMVKHHWELVHTEWITLGSLYKYIQPPTPSASTPKSANAVFIWSHCLQFWNVGIDVLVLVNKLPTEWTDTVKWKCLNICAIYFYGWELNYYFHAPHWRINANFHTIRLMTATNLYEL